MRSKNTLYGMAVLTLILGFSVAAKADIVIGSYDGSVSDRPFTGGSFSNLIADLTNSANFGAGGIDPNAVTIAPAVASVNAAILSGYNVFVMDEAFGLSPADAAALAAWVTGGGRLVIVDDSGGSGAVGANEVLSLLDGSSVANDALGVDGATEGSITTAGLSSVGLFGNLVGGTFATSEGSPLVAGPNSKIIGTNDGVNFLMETYAGSGAVLTTADVSFQNFFVPPASLFDNANNAALFENFISGSNGAVPSVPEPSSMVLLTTAMVLLGYSLKHRRQNM